MHKYYLVFCILLMSVPCFAANRGAIANLCNNLNASCLSGNESDCQAFSAVTCSCNESGICQRTK